eukprot:gene5951-biopygen2358
MARPAHRLLKDVGAHNLRDAEIPKTLIVTSLPADCSAEKLGKFLEQFDQVRECNIDYDLAGLYVQFI